MDWRVICFLYTDLIANLICGMTEANSDDSCFALVPYVEPMILRDFHSSERNVTINGRQFTFRQNWNGNGVAGVLWDSGIILARYISDHPEIATNRTVLELGAGLGLPSAVISYQDVKLLHVTDRASAIPLLEENMHRNANNRCNLKIFAFDWNADKVPQKYQVILGADLVYDSVALEPLIQVFKDATDKDTVIYLCSRIRYQKDRSFYDELKREHFHVREILHDAELDVHIFKITIDDMLSQSNI